LGEEPHTPAAFEQICTSQQLPSTGTPGFCSLSEQGRLSCGRCDNCCRASRGLGLEQDAGEELQSLLRLLDGARLGRSSVIASLKKNFLRSRRTDDDWHRVLDYAVHHGFVRLEISLTRESRKGFVSPQLTEIGQTWSQTGPHRFLVDFGHAIPAGPMRRARSPSPETLNSVADPPSADGDAVVVVEDVEIDTPEDDRPLAHLQAIERQQLISQPTPQRLHRRLQPEPGAGEAEEVQHPGHLQGSHDLKEQLASEVAALQALVVGLKRPRAGVLASALADVRTMRASLEAASPSPTPKRQLSSPGAVSIRSPSAARQPETKSRRTSTSHAPKRCEAGQRGAGAAQPSRGSERSPRSEAPPALRPPGSAPVLALVPRQPGGASASSNQLQKPGPKAVAKALPTRKKFSGRDREAASELLKKLMDASDFNSNQQGGSDTFRKMIGQAKQLAPAAKRGILEEVVQRHFLAKTPGKHRERLCQIITEWKAEGL